MVDYTEIYGVGGGAASLIGIIILLVFAGNLLRGLAETLPGIFKWYKRMHWDNDSIPDRLGGLFILVVLCAIVWAIFKSLFLED